MLNFIDKQLYICSVRFIFLTFFFIAVMTLVVKSNYAFKELCNNTCGLLEKEIFKESNVKESSENSDNSKDDKSETESNVESYYIRNHNSFLLYYDVNRLNNYTYHQSFFENQPKDIKDNPPELI